mgnify:CR=1 FL=1
MDIAARRKADPAHWRLATAIRALSMDAVEAANSGHPGMPMGMADVATVLFRDHLKFDAAAPNWFDRDRFVLSAGHGSMLIYSLLHLTGYEQMSIDQIRNFRQWGAITAGHPEYGHAEGIETTTGPLGQGIATAVGFAIAEEAIETMGTQVHAPSLKGVPSAQLAYLRAMADLTEPGRNTVSSTDVAEAVGKKPNQATDTRGKLMDRGLIEAPAWGRVSFTLPYIAEHLRSQGRRTRIS